MFVRRFSALRAPARLAGAAAAVLVRGGCVAAGTAAAACAATGAARARRSRAEAAAARRPRLRLLPPLLALSASPHARVAAERTSRSDTRGLWSLFRRLWVYARADAIELAGGALLTAAAAAAGARAGLC